MPPPSHVALLTTDFRPMTGGVADHLHRLAEAVAASVPLTVLTPAAQALGAGTHRYGVQQLPQAPERRLNGSAADRWPPLRRLRTGAYFLQLHGYGRKTIAQVESRWGPGAAVLIGLWDMVAHGWCAACRRANLPYVLFAHGVEITAPLYGVLPAWRTEDFQAAARVVGNSIATAKLAVERLSLPAQPAVVHPSVGPRPDADRIAMRAAGLRRELALASGPVILSLGRLVPRKGFDLALRAAAAVAPDHPDLTYVIGGDGPERRRLESLARDLDLSGRVRFPGNVDDLTKWALYDLCDLFVMPNRLLGGADWEGFGIVFLEAALAGRPSIAGQTGGAADAVEHGVSGLLVDPESPEALARALRQLLQDQPLRDRLGRAGAARAASRFTPSASAASLSLQLGWSR
ncbi:MAG: glycosyltransferase family 4 protein [Acidobacteria bacterium]|nr:glycosyltransferase family 4 protein [Acidobacteriota bacterium]